MKHILLVLLASWVCIGATVGVDYAFEKLQPHQKDRINNLLGIETDLTGAGYNVNQSKIAIGSGGLLGKGFLQGTQTKFNFVPEQSTDFIFCTVGEEWGFVGSAILIGLLMAFILRIIYLAERQRSDFSRIYGYGVASILFFHVAINIGMTIGMAPVIGIPLPFFQLRRFFPLGIYYFDFYLFTSGCQPPSGIQLSGEHLPGKIFGHKRFKYILKRVFIRFF